MRSAKRIAHAQPSQRHDIGGANGDDTSAVRTIARRRDAQQITADPYEDDALDEIEQEEGPAYGN